MVKLDAIGRATFHHIASHEAVRPTNRELRWLAHIERHGPQASTTLIDLTIDTHRCRDTALRAMQRLRAGGVLTLPSQQRLTARAEFNPYIYDTTPKARAFLKEAGLAEDTLRPTGHWWHAYQVGWIAGAIDVAAARAGVRYIPAPAILSRSGARLPIHGSGTTIIPDQLFALDYGGSFRAFVLEVDLGTEPLTSPTMRKSLSASIAAYAAAQQTDRLRSSYGLKAPVFVLWAMDARSRAEFVLQELCRLPPTVRAAHLVQWAASEGQSESVRDRYFSMPWARADLPSMTLNER